MLLCIIQGHRRGSILHPPSVDSVGKSGKVGMVTGRVETTLARAENIHGCEIAPAGGIWHPHMAGVGCHGIGGGRERSEGEGLQVYLHDEHREVANSCRSRVMPGRCSIPLSTASAPRWSRAMRPRLDCRRLQTSWRTLPRSSSSGRQREKDE